MEHYGKKIPGVTVVGKIDLENPEKGIKPVIEKGENSKVQIETVETISHSKVSDDENLIRGTAKVLPGITVIGKIDLDTFNKRVPKSKREKLSKQKEHVRSTKEILPDIESAMNHNITLVQERMSSFEGSRDNIIDAKGKINEYAFSGIYSEAAIEFDKKIAHEKKKGHYNTFESAVQEEYDTDDQDKIVEMIENDEQKSMRDGKISEDLLFLMMNKVAGDRYIAVRNGDYDDFENGVDMMLVDTETNAVICTFDATVSGYSSHMDAKIMRAKERVDQGKGLYVKYGVSFDKNQKMELGPIKNIPPLFLDLPKEDLERMLHVMDFHIDSPLSRAEIEVVGGLLEKLDNQIIDLDKRAAKNINYDSSREFVSHVRNTLAEISQAQEKAINGAA